MSAVHTSESYEIVIIGGGVIGCSIAYFLSLDANLKGKILVIEKDNSYQFSSTALSAASIRVQFSNPINVAISQYGAEFIRGFPERFGRENGDFDLGLRENGYLFLAQTAQQVEIMRENHEIQRAGGADVRLIDADEVKKRYPFLNTDDISLASIGESGEGWFDNMGLLNGLKEMSKRNNVKYLNGCVNALNCAGGSVQSVSLENDDVIHAGAFVNATGPRAAEIAISVGVRLPVEPRKRTSFVFQCETLPPENAPLIVDHRGVYLKPEGEFWMGACQPIDDPAVAFDDFEPRYQEFDDQIWPKAAQRAKIFEAIKMRRMWAGHYAFNTLDQNAILGLHPDVNNLYFANGFSGHGLQQAPAVGRGISELIRFGQYVELDLSLLGFDRVIAGKPFLERNVV